MKAIAPLATAALGILVAFATQARADGIYIDDYSYAAVAYSPETGELKYACGHYSRSSAERAALKKCDAYDARIVCWVNNGFCALAVSADGSGWGTGWSYGDGATNRYAMDRALAGCRENNNTARIAICLTSDGQYVYRPDSDDQP